MNFQRTLLLTLLCLAGNIVADEQAAKPITEQESRVFCQEFARRFLEGDGPWLSDHIDYSGMAWRATEGKQDGFSKGFRNAAKGRQNGVSNGVRNLIAPHKDFESYRFKSLRKVDGTWKGLFRLIQSSGAIDFHEIDLVRKTNGEIGVAEFYLYTTGETFTDTFRSVCQENENLQKNSQGNNKEIKDGYACLRDMSEAFQNKKYQTVMEIYEILPENFKEMKVAAMMRLRSSLQLDESIYEKVAEDHIKLFPNDTSKDMISIDAFFLAKKYDQAIAAIDRLIQRTGGDGYLSFLKASIYLMDKKPDESIRAAEEGMKQEDGNSNLYEVTLNASLQKKDHTLTKQMLGILESRFGFEFEDLTKEVEYADFVKSREYAAYLKAKNRGRKVQKPATRPQS